MVAYRNCTVPELRRLWVEEYHTCKASLSYNVRGGAPCIKDSLSYSVVEERHTFKASLSYRADSVSNKRKQGETNGKFENILSPSRTH